MIISNESVDLNDPKEFNNPQLFNDPQLFDDPKLFDDPQLFDDQLEVWTLIIQKSLVIPSSPMVLFIAQIDKYDTLVVKIWKCSIFVSENCKCVLIHYF